MSSLAEIVPELARKVRIAAIAIIIASIENIFAFIGFHLLS